MRRAQGPQANLWQLPPPTVDDRGRPVCQMCGQPVDPEANGTWRMVVGFVQQRAGGGAHGISQARPVGVFRHDVCHQEGGIQGGLL